MQYCTFENSSKPNPRCNEGRVGAAVQLCRSRSAPARIERPIKPTIKATPIDQSEPLRMTIKREVCTPQRRHRSRARSSAIRLRHRASARHMISSAHQQSPEPPYIIIINRHYRCHDHRRNHYHDHDYCRYHCHDHYQRHYRYP